jgi:hypothetical protein
VEHQTAADVRPAERRLDCQILAAQRVAAEEAAQMATAAAVAVQNPVAVPVAVQNPVATELTAAATMGLPAPCSSSIPDC